MQGGEGRWEGAAAITLACKNVNEDVGCASELSDIHAHDKTSAVGVCSKPLSDLLDFILKHVDHLCGPEISL